MGRSAGSSRVGIAVLAAGASRRFGPGDKLAVPLAGKALGEHAPAAAALAGFARSWVIASHVEHPCAPGWRASGFDVIANPRASQGMGTSVALAAGLARDGQCDALVIALADMPMVPAEHFAGLAKHIGALGAEGIVVSRSGTTRMPPAGFGSGHFARMMQMAGDAGARSLLGRGEAIDCPESWLVDVDTPAALARIEGRGRSSGR